jgi:hypothetical protein
LIFLGDWLTPTPIQSLLLTILDFFTELVGWVSEIASLFTSEPVLILTVGMVVVGFSVGIFGRLLRRG